MIDETKMVVEPLVLRDGTALAPGALVMASSGHTGTYLGLYKGGALVGDWTAPGGDPVARAVLCQNGARGALRPARIQ